MSSVAVMSELAPGAVEAKDSVDCGLKTPPPGGGGGGVGVGDAGVGVTVAVAVGVGVPATGGHSGVVQSMGTQGTPSPTKPSSPPGARRIVWVPVAVKMSTLLPGALGLASSR